jgi:O-6-methylguanine DNA methyltransferase
MIKTARHPPAHVLYGISPSPVGKLLIGVTGDGALCRLAFLCQPRVSSAQQQEVVCAAWQAAWSQTRFTRFAVEGDMRDRNLLLVGTAFQHLVWRALAKIPFGSLTTYSAIARRLGKPRAARAIGAACGANPVPYVIPCHRVVPSAGGLGGFSGGLAMKRLLLEKEGHNVRDLC